MSTPQVYQELDAHRARHILDISPSGRQPTVDAAVLQALRAGDAHLLGEVLYNDLQAAALQLRPVLGEVLEFGDSQGALGSLVSGSGPTIAFLAADTDDAVELQVTLASSGLKVIRAHGPVHGARIVSQS
jgi:4-diphosphocytidyl-2-C-methyl-D-erythritol kinase